MTYTYVPGTCNLGKSEIRRRQIVALIGAFLSISALVGLLGTDAPRAARWSLFAPLMVFAVGYIQSRKRFCLAYGLMGTFNLGKLGDIARVQNSEDRSADRKTALKILAQSAALALALTASTFLLPI